MKRSRKLFRTAFSHMARNPYHALAVILVMTQTFFVMAILAYVLLGANTIINFYESKAQLSAYFSKEINSEEQVADLKETLLATGRVVSITFTNKDEALKIFKSKEQDSDITNFITSDTLPTSFDIKTRTPNDLFEVEKVLKGDNRVKDVILLKEAIDKLSKMAAILRNAGIIGTISLLVTSLLIVLIVISLNISLHKEEIEIMRLVGANSGYVRVPFVVEGIMYGLISAVLAWALSWGAIYGLVPFISSFFEGIPLLPIPWELIGGVLGGLTSIGFLLGLIGATIATSKYLKVN